jgi:polyhydroxyalkanoate synthase
MGTAATAVRAIDARGEMAPPNAIVSSTIVGEPAVELSHHDPSHELAETMDRSLHYLVSRFTLGLSPMAMAQAYFDWAIHLSSSPGKQAQLWHKGARKAARLAVHIAHCAMSGSNEPCIAPLLHDKRFAGEAWQSWPFSILYQNFLLQQQWWHNAVTGVHGVSEQHERVLQFAFRQWLDVFSPSNFLLTNPELLQRTREESGQNLVRGFWNLVETGNASPIAAQRRFSRSSRSARTWQ